MLVTLFAVCSRDLNSTFWSITYFILPIHYFLTFRKTELLFKMHLPRMLSFSPPPIAKSYSEQVQGNYNIIASDRIFVPNKKLMGNIMH